MDQLHVIFGTGQVGRTLATDLAERGVKVRAVSQHRPPTLAEGIDWLAAEPVALLMSLATMLPITSVRTWR